MNRVALVEDRERMSAMVNRALASAGIACDVFARMDFAWQALHSLGYAAVIVDRGLPDGDGLQLVARLRTAGNAVPCLMLTARDAVHDRIEGLEAGADDYLVKPFSMEELVARVRALLRRPATTQALAPTFMDLCIDPSTGTLSCAGQPTVLASAELQIMLTLVRAEGQTVRRSALQSAAWGLAEAVTPNALDVAMHRLRRKLQRIGSGVQIANLRGLGYALQGPDDHA